MYKLSSRIIIKESAIITTEKTVIIELRIPKFKTEEEDICVNCTDSNYMATLEQQIQCYCSMLMLIYLFFVLNMYIFTLVHNES